MADWGLTEREGSHLWDNDGYAIREVTLNTY